MSFVGAHPEIAAAAIDLGATSGRVVVGRVAADRLDLTEVARFANTPHEVDGVWRWDLASLWREIGAGVRVAVLEHGATTVGIDSWAVDYGLLDAGGRLLADPACYRDPRTERVLEPAGAIVGRAAHYRITGLQYQPFNSVYQLLAEPPDVLGAKAERMLLLPDLLSYLMTGVQGAERTNASTTGLYDAVSGTWSSELCDRLGIPTSLLAPLVEPGSSAGWIRPEVAQAWGIDADAQIEVVRVGSHDTASAVAAVPADGDRFAYVSCGTWSLVGLELDAPVLTEASRAANFTNEVGTDSTIRYLRNLTGLWLLSECLRAWADAGSPHDRDELIARAVELPAGRWRIDAESAGFVPAGDMPARIQAAAARRGPAPTEPAEVVRCIVDSLAVAHADSVALAGRLADRRVDVVHMVGGGSAMGLLCQATADACGLPVVAGPVEATAIGNLLMQARAAGVLPTGAEGHAAGRALVRATQPLTRYEPGGR
ncbi:MAG TPA: rhamnulokinase family protein [Actinopolymorphaceae bacterium]